MLIKNRLKASITMEEELSKNQKRIIEEIRKNPQITHWELGMIIGIGTDNVTRNVRILKLKGLVRRHGPHYKSVDRYWEVLPTPEIPKMKDNINEIQKKIIEEVKEDSKITQRKLSIKLDRNETNISKNMRLLKLMGILTRVGPTHKEGYWEILK